MRPATAGPVLHKVEAGDTLGTLSRLYGVSPEKLREANQWQHVDECESFWIPASPAHWVVHTVAEGESLALISQGYNIPLQQLRDANGLLSDPLKAGSTLYLPRAAKPSWNAPARKTLQASRGARPVAVVPIAKAPVAAPVSAPRVSPILSEKPSGKWVQVTSLDGRKGWIQQSELVFTPPQASHPSSAERARERSMTLAYGQKLNPDQKSAIRKISEHLATHQLYVEPDHIAAFVEAAREILANDAEELLNVTIRSVSKDQDTALPYAKTDSFGFVMLFNVERSAEGSASLKDRANRLIEAALALGGAVGDQPADSRRFWTMLALILPVASLTWFGLSKVTLVMSPSIDAWAVTPVPGTIARGDLVQFMLSHPVAGPRPVSVTKRALCLPGEQHAVQAEPAEEGLDPATSGLARGMGSKAMR